MTTTIPSPLSLGKALRTHREQAKLTRPKLAARHGYTLTQLRAWEVGIYSPNIWSLYKLAGHLSTSPQAILLLAETIEETA